MKQSQIAVLDTGGQYCHLIARKVRELGVSSEVFPSAVALEKVRHAKGLIISGGPHSVYDPGAPSINQAVLTAGIPVLGICYGQQLIAYQLGGKVEKGNKGEYGLAMLDVLDGESDVLRGVRDHQQIWMSHRDSVVGLPAGFHVTATTATCKIAAVEDAGRKLYGVQFHPEVVHTTEGRKVLENFLFSVCRCGKDWNAGARIEAVEEEIRKAAAGRRVFFFVSGGVDSTVAFTLCLRALGTDRVHGVYVDTGLMRTGETQFVEETFERLGHGTVEIEHAQAEFLPPLAKAADPEQKRHIIGEQFVKVQERIIESRGLLGGAWVLGQGTIYPDTIESGGTEQAATIKTHHNRVPGIQKLIDEGRIVEPLADFYKDEVRAIGRQLGLPARLLDRHPFPGPGLAIRCLCADTEAAVSKVDDGWILPVRSVGVQGDSRTYSAVLALDEFPGESSGLQKKATELVNRLDGVNRVVALAASRKPLAEQRMFPARLSADRLDLLRAADAAVREICEASGFEAKVWQFPVVLIPLGTSDAHDSVVLRPVQSVDGMTADSVAMPDEVLRTICAKLLEISGIAAVYYDLTHKPPGTIEWE